MCIMRVIKDSFFPIFKALLSKAVEHLVSKHFLTDTYRRIEWKIEGIPTIYYIFLNKKNW